MYSLRPATAGDYDFLYELHRLTMHDYIDALWGWNEAWQAEYFAHKFDPSKRQIVQVDGEDAGVLVVEEREGCLYLGLIEILPEFQGQGIGSAIIHDLLERAAREERPLILHVLRSNEPARRLYERLGFAVVSEEEMRYKMVHPAAEHSS